MDDNVVHILGEPFDESERQAASLAARLRPTLADLEEAYDELVRALDANRDTTPINPDAAVRQQEQRRILLRQLVVVEDALAARRLRATDDPS